jgi:hypothetical protein
MHTFLHWFVANYSAGGLYVLMDLRGPDWDRPSYARTSRGRWMVRFLWLPAAAAHLWSGVQYGRGGAAVWGYLGKRVLPCLVAMIAIGALLDAYYRHVILG